ncbi:MAG: shikimate kinase [Acidobacteria bacterium]|nr:shikimate kinase [Acidobacteriota bacterium]MCI0566622.1 shikimate kinase [Acidobacteriota bacterium]
MSLPISEQIYLVGFMGAGKTTSGAELAALLGWRFVDLDEAICLRGGKSIPEIFRDGGEPVFRRLEREILISLTSLPKIVVATGGGTYVADENRNLVEAAGWSVWLQVGLSEAMRRCGGGIGRPLWGSRAEIEALYRHRQEFYRCARIQVDTEGIPPSQVAARAMEGLLAKGFVCS